MGADAVAPTADTAPPTPPTLARSFASDDTNALTVVRLLLAVSVLVWHSFPVTGRWPDVGPVIRLLGQGGVDAFFAISGFLVTRSWLRRPDWRRFLRARALRILPGYWLALLFTAGIAAPLAIRWSGDRLPDGYPGSAAGYVLGNAGLHIVTNRIAGTPSGLPFTAAWNASIWTLQWEFGCYLGVGLLGITGLLRRRWVIPTVWLVSATASAVQMIAGADLGGWSTLVRFVLMFSSGALLRQFADRLPIRLSWLVVALLFVGLASLLPDYRPLAALPLAYLTLGGAAFVRTPALCWRTDLSYGVYVLAFPVQQLLASAGLARLPLAVFAVLALAITLPLAALSWRWVERPALVLARRSRD